MACKRISSFSATTLSNTYYDSNGNTVDVDANTPLKKDNEVHLMLIRHLYRRIGYGASLADIEYIHDNNKTLGAIVNELIDNATATSLPEEFDWSVRSTLSPHYEFTQNGMTSYPRLPRRMYTFMIANFWVNECITESIKSKLLMFWHSHFSIKIDDYKESYAVLQYFKILYNNTFGNFKELVKKIGRTPMMLFFLSGFDSSGEPTGEYINSGIEPNENYARELLELFTMGIQDKNGINNYTENDIAAIARSLTGWRIYGDDDPDTGSVGFQKGSEEELKEILDETKFHFDYKQHDWGTKTLFKNTPNEVSFNSLINHWKSIPGNDNEPKDLPDVTVIATPREKDDHENSTQEEKYVSAGTDEYNTVHDILFDKKQHEIAYFICKKLYEFYVYADTDAEVFQNMYNSDMDVYLEKLVNVFKYGLNNVDPNLEPIDISLDLEWGIEDVLKVLFKSQHFYDVGIMGTQIKSHVESSVSLLRSAALRPIDDTGTGDYQYRLTLLTSDKAGASPEYEGDNTESEPLNPNYNGEAVHPEGEYPAGQPLHYANNSGQVNIMTGEGGTLEDVTIAKDYFFNKQTTWAIKKHSESIGQDLFMPPSVEGWPGHRDWINEYTLVKRQEMLLCLLTDISVSEPKKFSASTKEKFRQLAENLLILEYGSNPLEESDVTYGGCYGKTSQYQNPEKLVRVLWRHFVAVEPEGKIVNNESIGQIVDAVAVYVDGWLPKGCRPRLDIRGCDGSTAITGEMDCPDGYPDSTDCLITEKYQQEMGDRVIRVLEYFVRQPEFHLT